VANRRRASLSVTGAPMVTRPGPVSLTIQPPRCRRCGIAHGVASRLAPTLSIRQTHPGTSRIRLTWLTSKSAAATWTAPSYSMKLWQPCGLAVALPSPLHQAKHHRRGPGCAPALNIAPGAGLAATSANQLTGGRPGRCIHRPATTNRPKLHVISGAFSVGAGRHSSATWAHVFLAGSRGLVPIVSSPW